ncbi:hypothetical protein CF326_g4800 [Tilletia indica]|nr:hypothetical protein CF326_g4800 [Tilletia indica]
MDNNNTIPPSTEDINTLINTIHQHTPPSLNITLTPPTSIDHSLNNITRILKPIADQLRSDNNHSLRHSLGSSTHFTTAAVQLLLSTLSLPHTPTTTAEAQLHILRLFANLCIDSPTNRTALLNVHAPQAIITFLSSLLALSSSTTTPFYPADILPLLRTAVGALLNMQLAHNPTRATLRAYPPTIPILAHLSYSPAIYSPSDVRLDFPPLIFDDSQPLEGEDLPFVHLDVFGSQVSASTTGASHTDDAHIADEAMTTMTTSSMTTPRIWLGLPPGILIGHPHHSSPCRHLPQLRLLCRYRAPCQ